MKLVLGVGPYSIINKMFTLYMVLAQLVIYLEKKKK